MSDAWSDRMRQSSIGGAEWLRIGGLLFIVLLAWCAANRISTPEAVLDCTCYTENPEKSDVINAYVNIKAVAEGQWVPFGWKSVKSLNAPYEANWNDYPLIEESQLAFLGLLGYLFGWFGGLNIGMLLGNLLAAIVFYLIAWSQGCSPLWRFTAALAFGLAPFIFAHSPYHVGCEWVWYVPLYLPVWRWVSTAPGLRPGDPRFARSLFFSAVTGLSCPYFTNIFCQLTLLGGVLRYVQDRSRTALLAVCAVIGVSAIGFIIDNVDMWSFKLLNGSNQGALVREYKWLEIYGLKIKDLFIPPLTHRSDALASFSQAHRQAAPLLDEGASYQGIVGLACLIWLVFTAVRDMVKGREKDVPMEAWQVLWILLVFTTGGLNALFAATTGFTMFRGGCRYSIVILAITLLWAARRLSAMQAEAERTRPAGTTDWRWLAAAAVLSSIILWDQVPRPPTAEEAATITRLVKSDREFTEKMEASLPDGAMVFQMPVMEFPEAPIPGVPPYDHFRPYLFSKNLRFSFGTHKGREREKWQPAVQGKFFEGAALDQQAGVIRVNQANARAAVEELKRLGFSAIYINRNGFPDRGRGIEEALLELGYAKPPIRNASGDLACIVLEK
jgi:hypothetical protein